MEKYRCRCEYIYDPAVGDPKAGIAPGTPFLDLPDTWVCPLCGLPKVNFVKLVAGVIKVKVKCFSTLVKADACDYQGSTEYEMPERATIRDLIEKLQLPVEAIKLVFLNGKEAPVDTLLKDGDQLGFSPATGAM